MEVSYGPDDLVTCQQIAQYYGVRVAVVQGWRDRGRLIAASRHRKNNTHLFRWSDVLALDYEPGFHDEKHNRLHCPPGHMVCQDAAIRLGVSENNIRLLCRRGHLAHQTRRAPGIHCRHSYFPNRESVEKLLVIRAAAKKARDDRKKAGKRPRKAQRATIAPARDIISPDDRECLEARRRLWNEAGRKWRKSRKKCRNCLAMAR